MMDDSQIYKHLVDFHHLQEMIDEDLLWRYQIGLFDFYFRLQNKIVKTLENKIFLLSGWLLPWSVQAFFFLAFKIILNVLYASYGNCYIWLKRIDELIVKWCKFCLKKKSFHLLIVTSIFKVKIDINWFVRILPCQFLWKWLLYSNHRLNKL
jgi:hypothetical protein